MALTNRKRRILQVAAAKQGGGGLGPAIPLDASYASMEFKGDSITAGSNASTTNNRWVNKLVTNKGATIANNGIGSTVMQATINPTNGDNAAWPDSGRIIALPTDTAYSLNVFGYGLNDARYAPTGTMNITQFIQDYRMMLFRQMAAGRDLTKLLLMTPHYITDAGLAIRGATRSQYEAHVDAVKTIAVEFGCFLGDSYTRMRDNGGDSLIDTGDNIHPLDAGHQQIYLAALNAVRYAVTPPANPFVHLDLFTDTNGTLLQAHTGQLGATWALQVGGVSGATIQSNRLYSATANSTLYASAVAPADVEVLATSYMVTSVNNDRFDVAARMDPAADTCYFVRYIHGSGVLLYKRVAGVATQLGSTFAVTLGATSTKTNQVALRIQGQGASQVVSAWVDGVQRIAVNDDTPELRSSNGGKVGIRFPGAFASSTTGFHITAFEARGL